MRLKIEAPMNQNETINSGLQTAPAGAPIQPSSASPNLCYPNFLHTNSPLDPAQLMYYQQQQQGFNTLGGTTSPSLMHISQPSR